MSYTTPDPQRPAGITPNPARPWYARLTFLPGGSPYWWMHWLVLALQVACFIVAWPTRSSIDSRFIWMSAGNLANLVHVLINVTGQRRRA